MIVGGMAFNNKRHSYSTPSDVGFLEVGKSSWQLRCYADSCWLDTNFYSDRTWPQFIKVGCIYIYIYYIYIFIMIAKFFSWKVGKLGSWLCQLAFPKFPLLCQGITRQQSPITANLLGGPGQQWQGIPASHRWVPGERIRPRGWLQMSVNSQSCELQPPKWCGLPVHSFNLLSHWQPLTSLVPFLGSTVLYLFERQRSTQPFYTLKQETNQRGAINVMLQSDG